MVIRVSALLILSHLACLQLLSQFPPQTRDSFRSFSVNGTIVHPAGTVVGNLTVHLSEMGSREMSQTTMANPDGSFEFDDVPAGSYVLGVVSVSGVEITQQLVDVRDSYTTVEVTLPEPKGGKPGTGTVSMAQLLHRVPEKAIKEYNAAVKLFKKKTPDTEGAIDHLKKAVAIDPKFVEAQSILGKWYLQKEDSQKAIAAYEQVVKMNPKAEEAYTGISASMLRFSRFSEAETAARHAVEIDEGSHLGRFLLGLSLAAESKYEEALADLKKAETAFPNAFIVSAQILARKGESTKAAGQLQSYLQTGDTSHRNDVTLWLQQLKAGSVQSSLQGPRKAQ